MIDIEEGLPTLIPKELSQENYPLSYRFYDPIIATVKENLSKEKWKVLINRYEQAEELYYENDNKVKLMKFFGCIESNDPDHITF